MRAVPLLPATILALAFVAPSAHACGEGVFSMGDGLRYQGYLAPRPATVLVYEADGHAGDELIAVYRGIARAGHKVTVVADPAQLPTVLASQSFDVVIGTSDDVGAVTAALPADASPRQLVVVPQKPSRADNTASRAFVKAGASVGTFLGVINRLMKD